MKIIHWFRNFIVQWAILYIIVLSMAHSIYAQATVPAQIRSVTAFQVKNSDNHVVGWSIYIAFSAIFDPTNKDDVAKAINTSNYKLININRNTLVAISEAIIVPIQGASSNMIQLKIPSGDSLNTTDLFHLYALNIVFNGKPAKDALQHPVEVRIEKDTAGNVVKDRYNNLVAETDKTTTGGINPNKEPKAVWALKPSKNRDDSDIYGSYELTTARNKATTGTGDIKLAIPFYSTFWHRTSRFSPVADVKTSSDFQADPDSLKFAFEWFLPLYVYDNPNTTFPFTSIDVINSFKVEAPKNFDNVNALWESRWLFLVQDQATFCLRWPRCSTL